MSDLVLAIDPGSSDSAWVLCNGMNIIAKAKEDNHEAIKSFNSILSEKDNVEIVIEYPAPRGQPMYTQIVDTIFWIGMFVHATVGDKGKYTRIDRKDVKMHLCGNTKAKDGNVRAALLSRYPASGGGKIGQIGIKNNPGPLFGVSNDIWAALGVAITFMEDSKW